VHEVLAARQAALGATAVLFLPDIRPRHQDIGAIEQKREQESGAVEAQVGDGQEL